MTLQVEPKVLLESRNCKNMKFKLPPARELDFEGPGGRWKGCWTRPWRSKSRLGAQLGTRMGQLGARMAQLGAQMTQLGAQARPWRPNLARGRPNLAPKRRPRGSQSSILEGSGDVLGRIFLGLGKVLVSFLKVWRPLGFWLLCGVLTCLLLFFAAFWLFWQLFDS